MFIFGFFFLLYEDIVSFFFFFFFQAEDGIRDATVTGVQTCALPICLVSPVAFSRTPGGMVGKVWKWSGSETSLTACQSGSHTGCHIGSMSHEQDSSRPRRPIFAT